MVTRWGVAGASRHGFVGCALWLATLLGACAIDTAGSGTGTHNTDDAIGQRGERVPHHAPGATPGQGPESLQPQPGEVANGNEQPGTVDGLPVPDPSEVTDEDGVTAENPRAPNEEHPPPETVIATQPVDPQTGETFGGHGPNPFAGAANGTAHWLAPGLGPDSAHDCAPLPDESWLVQPAATELRCFYGEQDPTVPAVMLESVVDTSRQLQVLHLRLTFNPNFVDHTWGENAVQWQLPRSLDDLQDEAEVHLELLDGRGERTVDLKAKYLAEDDELPSGYGEGSLKTRSHGKGAPKHSVLAATTSLLRNINACGLSDYGQHSPATDNNLSSSPHAPHWDYRVAYEWWVDTEVFRDRGFGGVRFKQVRFVPNKNGQHDGLVPVEQPCPN